jgi:hypothetical protein
MREELPLINERTAAQKTLLAATRRAGDAMSPFAAWLLGGFGAAFALVLANIETVSKFIAVTHIRFGLARVFGEPGGRSAGHLSIHHRESRSWRTGRWRASWKNS